MDLIMMAWAEILKTFISLYKKNGYSIASFFVL
jgi:hypothetical protein